MGNNTRQPVGRPPRLMMLQHSDPFVLFLMGSLFVYQTQVEAFPLQLLSANRRRGVSTQHQRRLPFRSQMYATAKDTEIPSVPSFSENDKRPISSAIEQGETEDEADSKEAATAATGTVNQRLLAELQEAKEREKNGPRSSLSSKAATTIFGSQRKTDAEREQAIAEARDLNGVNPVTALVGSATALAGAFAFWQLTQYLAEYFAMHPTSADQVYVVARLSAVVRNVAIGLAALASGFFGVTGMGILSLGVRVAYGVATGELDPTPKERDDTKVDKKVEMEEIWKLMTNQSKKRGQR